MCICSDPLAMLNDTLRRCVCVTLQLCSLCWRTSVFVLTHWLYSTPLHIASGVQCVLIHMYSVHTYIASGVQCVLVHM